MFRLTRFLFTMLILGAVATAALAQTSEQTTTARDRQSVNITVYNSNLGLVRETRRLTLPAGRIALRFADVTAQIRPETVHLASLIQPTSLRCVSPTCRRIWLRRPPWFGIWITMRQVHKTSKRVI